MKNACKDCIFYTVTNNTCQSKKCVTRGDGRVSLFDRLFCEPYRGEKSRRRAIIMSLNYEMTKYTELTGEDGTKIPISRLGGYLDGYEKGRAEAIQEQKEFWDMQNHKAYEQGRADATEETRKECIDIIKQLDGQMAEIVRRVFVHYDELKGRNDTKSPCCRCTSDQASCCGCPEYFEWKSRTNSKEGKKDDN